MGHIDNFSSFISLFEKEGPMAGTSTSLENIKLMAKGQKYAFDITKEKGIKFDLKIDNKLYIVTLYDNGRYVIMSGDKELYKGGWYASKWGLSIDYEADQWFGLFSQEEGTAGTGLNAIDMPIGRTILKKQEGWKSLIKSTDGKFIPLVSSYEPTSKCISPKTLKEISNKKCILTVGSRGDVVKVVQSMLNFVLSKEALVLLKKSGFYSGKGIDSVTEMDIGTDGKFGKNTKKAVEQFQLVNSNLVKDGIVGRGTLTVLKSASDEIKKLEKKEVEKEMIEIERLEPKKAQELQIEIDPIEIKKLDTLPPLEVELEINDTLKKIRKEKKKKGSRRKNRLLRKLARLQKREKKVRNKLDKIKESSLFFIECFDTFDI